MAVGDSHDEQPISVDEVRDGVGKVPGKETTDAWNAVGRSHLGKLESEAHEFVHALGESGAEAGTLCLILRHGRSKLCARRRME
jgi:hypothetical protein